MIIIAALLHYVAMEFNPTERRLSKLGRILPTRRFKKGSKPCVTGPVAMGPNVDDESQWDFPDIELTEAEKRLLLATVVEIGVKTVFRTHLYQFGGKIYHQQSGGPIGLRATGAIARIVMGEWDLKLKKMLAENQISTEEDSRYIDDVRTILHAIKKGWRWTGKQLEFKESWRKEEEEINVSETAKTASVLGEMMNCVMPELKFTTETHEDFQDGTLPTLDTQLWVDEEGFVRYRYFEKPMCTKKVISRRSAMGENGKVASLSQDLIRRLKNTSQELSQQVKNEIVDQYCTKMASSGYSRNQMHRIVTAGLRGFEKLSRKQMHRPAATTKVERNRKKLTGKTQWFRNRRKNDQKNKAGKPHGRRPPTAQRCPGSTREQKETRTTSVLFVEQTPNGELARRFREAEVELSKLTGFRIKIVERNGTKVKNILHVTNPWAEGKCERAGCYPCATGETKCCYKRNIVYTNTCRQCKGADGKGEAGTGAWYVGESSRSAFERGGEHWNDWVKKQPDSHIFKHQELAHPDQEQPDFEFRIKGSFRSALERQVTEAVLIRRAGAAALNSKGVYNRCSLPRLAVECGNKTNKEQADNEKKEDTILWQYRKQPKRADVEHARRPRKKQRREKEEEEVVIQGVRKRKAAELKSLDEFNSDCKRMRPEFDPELECDNSSKNPDKKAAGSINLNTTKSKIIFFSVFSKSNKELNNQVMFKPNKQQQKVKEKLKNRRNGSSRTGKLGRGGDIRTYLKPMNKPGGAEPKMEDQPTNQGGTDRQTNTPPPSATEDGAGAEQNSNQTRAKGETKDQGPRQRTATVITPNRLTDRQRESGVKTWDPALNSSSSNQLLSIYALPFVPSTSSQVNRLSLSESTFDK